ncbi:MAG: energy transducer TonB [Acidobacteriota bacterium]|nr:energy transducer TonB [Acidobacteriota bacterium]
MRREKKIARSLLCALALAANGVGAFAQGQARVSQGAEKAATERAIQEVQITSDQLKVTPRLDVLPAGQGEYSFTFISSELSFDSKVVKGAPFSADAVTESVQVLGDGNRITHTTTSKLYRDAEGRTRREQSLAGIGALVASEDAPQTVFINDPVSGSNYVLNTKSHTATKGAATYSFLRKTEGGAAVTSANDEYNKVPAINGGVLNGKAIKKVSPDYPAVARAAGAQGEVAVQITVDEQGNVISARAVSGHPLLQKAAVEAAGQWKFSPTKLSGQPVKVSGIITFNFALEGKEGGAGQGTGQGAGQGIGEGAAASQLRVAELPSAGGGSAGGGLMVRTPFGEKTPKYPESQESLGTQSFDGVQADGTRSTVTIPAGAMGNERPIQIVSERWYSNELQTVVMTKHSDPRFGETTYRLTNISRSEPDHSLFEVPGDYKVVDRGDLERRMMINRMPQQQQ